MRTVYIEVDDEMLAPMLPIIRGLGSVIRIEYPNERNLSASRTAYVYIENEYWPDGPDGRALCVCHTKYQGGGSLKYGIEIEITLPT